MIRIPKRQGGFSSSEVLMYAAVASVGISVLMITMEWIKSVKDARTGRHSGELVNSSESVPPDTHVGGYTIKFNL